MARSRTGSLERRPDGWHARITVDVTNADGSTRQERRRIPLGTHDRQRAKRMLAKLVRELEAGRLVVEAKHEAQKAETVAEAARAWWESRKARAIAMADTELGYLEHHVFPEIGTMPVEDVRRADIRRVLEAAAARKPRKGTTPTLAKETVAKIRAVMHRFFGTLEADERILTNPVRGVDVPKARVDKRPRTPILDGEYNALFSCPKVDVETKVLALTARTLGGARTAECMRWDWSMIDVDAFEGCTLARAKTGDFQELEIPEMLRPFLRAWWAKHECPTSGPVFPVTRGKRKGQARGKQSFAGRLRKALRVAFEWAGLPIRRELFEDTAHSRKTDFHTRRREYVSALATSGANEQTAMALAHHADSKVHRRYQIAQIRSAPLAALPRFNADIALQSSLAGDDSSDPLREVSGIRAGHGIRTRDIQLGKRAKDAVRSAMPHDGASPTTADTTDETRRIAMRQNDSSRGDDSRAAETTAIDPAHFRALSARWFLVHAEA